MANAEFLGTVFQLNNAELLQRKLAAIPTKLQGPLKRQTEISAINIMTNAIRNVQAGPASGRIYQKYKPRRVHQASAPGESPASDTGKLASNITYALHDDKLGADIGTNLKHGLWMETGTKGKGDKPRIRARPWLFPAAEDERVAHVARMTKALNKALAKMGVPI